MSLAWYIQRIKTFSPEEVLYRIRQRVRTHILDKRLQKTAEVSALPSSEIISEASETLEYPIFEKSIDVFKPIDWHLDVQSGKRFPLTFAHKINIRSDEFGSAKHVWEVNRQLFLVHITLLYKKTGARRYLDLVMYHLTCWKNDNPYLTGVNWYSNIEVNLRLINWYYCWQLLDVDHLQKSDDKVSEFVQKVWLPLIFEHAEFSYQHPSLYSSANNHLVSEYAGLFIAACKWEIPHRKSRLAYAQQGLEREILLQNSPDGINREEAAEYIQFIDDFFFAAAIVGDSCGHSFSKSYKDRLHQMATYLNQLLDCKGNYLMYGDGDDGFCLRPDKGGHFNNFNSLLSAFAAYFDDACLKRPGARWDDKCELLLGPVFAQKFERLDGHKALATQFYKESGHYIFRKQESATQEILLHFDAAPLGFLSIAAHGHADALSVILHVDGQPILVDPGTFTYHTHKEWRRYFVSTLAHNTVCVGGNQATLAGPTLWLNHYKCKTLEADTNNELVEASHNGYEKIGVTHTRKVQFLRESNEFVITDVLMGLKGQKVEIPFHLHPEVEAVPLSGNRFDLKTEKSRAVRITLDEKLQYKQIRGAENPILGWYSEHFGEKIPTSVLYGQYQGDGPVEFVTKIQILE